jgi:ribosomal protein S18 acetylase RimI-like enzyme
MVLEREGVRIRLATTEDAAALGRVHVDAWRAAYCGLVPDERLEKLDCGRSRNMFLRSMREGPEETYVVEEAGAVVGFLTLGRCRDDDVDCETTAELWGIYVAPAHWRRGTGTELCRFGEELLRARGHTSAVLWVFAGNANARRFYEAMGYASDGASKILEVGKPLEAIRYRRGL